MLGTKRWQTVAKIMMFALVSIVIVLISGGHLDEAHAAFWGRSRTPDTQTTVKTTGIAEASPPIVLQELRQALDNYQPQVTILSPRRNEVLADNTVSVRFLVNDLPLFKNETFGLGPHLHVLLDNQPYQAVYDINQPLVFNDLEPGTHTIRAFASRPWHESFKNDGSFAQVTFHVFTKTQDNSPNPDLPLLTYSRPQGTYGAEPILLDFYLTNAPLHLVAQADAADDIADWQIRCTVNGNRFVIDRWQPLYLKGFKPGKNWVQLEYLDDKGNPVPNVFNNTVRIVNYQPNGDDTLSKLVRGDLPAADVRGIVDSNYVPPAPVPIVEPSPEPSPELTPEPSPEPAPEPVPELTPEPVPDSAPTVEMPLPETAPNLETPDRTSPIAPLPLPEPAPTSPIAPTPAPIPSPQPSHLEPSPSESIVPPIVPLPAAPDKSRSPEAPDVIETKPASPAVQPASPEMTTPTIPNAFSGQERLRQLRQQLGQYLPQRQAIRVPPTPVNAPSDRVVPGTAPPLPSVSIPAPLPPTLPEIIDATPFD